MGLIVRPGVGTWYKENYSLEGTVGMRIYTQLYSGIPTVFPSNYLGVMRENLKPEDVVAHQDGVLFGIYDADRWILDDYDIEIKLDSDGEPIYVFHAHDGVEQADLNSPHQCSTD